MIIIWVLYNLKHQGNESMHQDGLCAITDSTFLHSL